MQSLKSIRLAEVDNFFKQSFEQKKLIPLYITRTKFCYIALSRKKADGSRPDILPFRFFFFFCRTDRVRDTDRETLTCHVHARRYSSVCSATGRNLGVHVYATCVVERTKRHKINGTILSQKKTGGFTASASFRLRFGSIVCETRTAKLPPVTCMQSCYRLQRTYCAAVCTCRMTFTSVARVAHVSALQMQRNFGRQSSLSYMYM